MVTTHSTTHDPGASEHRDSESGRMEYRVVRVSAGATTIDQPAALEELLNAQAASGWRFRAAIPVDIAPSPGGMHSFGIRGNVMLIFERDRVTAAA